MLLPLAPVSTVPVSMDEDTLRTTRFKRLCAARDAYHTALLVKRARRYLIKYPEHGPAWHMLGIALTDLARYNEAEQALWNALRLCPEHLRRIPLCSMGHFHDARGELARAARWYKRAIDAAPNHAAGYIYLGGVLARQGRLREAEKIHRQATETCDEGCIDEAFLNLALCFALWTGSMKPPRASARQSGSILSTLTPGKCCVT